MITPRSGSRSSQIAGHAASHFQALNRPDNNEAGE